MSVAAQLLCWCLLTVAALAVGMHFYPARHPLTIALAAAAPVLMLAVVVPVVGFALLHKWSALAVSVVLAAAGIWTQAPLYLADPSGAPGTPVTVLGSNIELGQGDVARIAELVDTHEVDILVVTELTPRAADTLAKTDVSQRLPYSYVQAAPGSEGTGVWSRYPISAPRLLAGFALANLAMTITVESVPVRFLALHPAYPLDPARWSDELGRLAEVFAAVPASDPVIAAGDFNSTRDHVAYRTLLAGGYHDAGELAGAGWLPTYPADRVTGALFAIDHVVVRGVSATSMRTEHVPDADHLAVVAVLNVPSR